MLCDDLSNRVDNIVYIGFGHSRVDRQRHAGVVDGLGLWHVTSSVAKVLLVERVKMHGNKMHARAYVVCMQRVDESGTIQHQALELKTDRVQVIHMATPFMQQWSYDFRHGMERAIIEMSIVLARVDEAIKAS